MKTLEFEQMENLTAGKNSCEQLTDGISGAALIIGYTSWYSGWGAGIALGLGAVGYIGGMFC